MSILLGIFALSFSIVWADSDPEKKYKELQNFTKVMSLVQQYYVEDVDSNQLLQGGIRGMLRGLDPHTDYLAPEVYAEFQKETSGEFGGVGVEISVIEEQLTVISPIEDTPAWKAGIEPGDKVIGLNGKSTKGMSILDAAKEMRGKEGSVLKMLIFRDSFKEPKEFAIMRGKVKLSSVKHHELGGGLVYVRITSFIENTYADLKKALAKYESKKGLLIDLRRNPGGLLDQAILISDLFLESGLIVSTVGRGESGKESVFAKQAETAENYPIVVLIDSSSASASEIVAGALQDNKRALIVGEKSFGKGSVQSIVKLGDGSALKLTVARYFTPSGRSIQAEGIEPDIQIARLDAEKIKEATQERRIREADIAGHLLGDKEKAKAATDNADKSLKKVKAQQALMDSDYQVQQAVSYLKTLVFTKDAEAAKTVN